MHLRANKKTRLEDEEFISNISDADYSRHEFVRIYAVGKVFSKVIFKQTNFIDCYFRNCRFVDCDFTGASIKGSNLRGAQFENCAFKYTSWENSHLDEDFMTNCLPSEENLGRDLIRSLRVNYAAIGDYGAVNRAAAIEVRLTGEHLFKAAYSRQAYYRAKYKGWDRIRHILQHAQWKALDLIWGNGESLLRIAISTLMSIFIISFLYMIRSHVPFLTALHAALWQFWGKDYLQPMPSSYALALAIAQFISFGLFMAVLVKRLSRR